MIPTPHISAGKDDFAKTILMPGDPLRSKFIAETYLEDRVLVNDVRGVQGYTGTYKGKRVSVMASGMGMPSMGIYSYELFNFYDVDNIIRIGSAGGVAESIRLRDIVLGMAAYTDSGYGAQYGFKGTIAPSCSYELLRKATASAEKLGIELKVGPIYSTDVFYNEDDPSPTLRKLGVLATEMEAAALYMNAARAGKNALAICTISDIIGTGEGLSASDRQTTFRQMMEIALDMA